jgi:bacteriorhodopsin
MGNQALTVNPPGSLTVFNLTTEGSDWLWTVFTIMALSTIIVALLSLRLHPEERRYYLFSICILATASLAYFCMASDLGFTPVEVLQNGPGARQFWYVRYIDWVITTPLLLAELLLTAGLPINSILLCVFADIVMIICGLIGGLVPSEYKWAFYVFGCAPMLWIFYNIFSGIKLTKTNGGENDHRNYIILASWMCFVWTLYPIAWGLCEGSNTISVTGEMVFYGILDLLAKPAFTGLLLFFHRDMVTVEYFETEISAAQLKYLQQQKQRLEQANASYVMDSSEVIRSPC